MKVLVTRTDRLGDVLLATPVLKRILEVTPQAQVTFLVQKQWMPVLQFGDRVQLMEYRHDENVKDLSARLEREKFDAAVVIRDEKKISQAVFQAGIPTRVGPISTLRSILFFNRGKFQKRSQCIMHEAEYNLSLLTKIGIPFEGVADQPRDLPRSWVQMSTEAAARVSHWLEAQALTEKSFVCVHPGSSGSARYVSEEALILLMKQILQHGKKVVLTGGPHERELLLRYQKAVPSVILFDLVGLDDLAELYRKSASVVAHGTGPLHLAAAVDAPVMAIFPPLFVLSEKRWGPLTSQRVVWVPPQVNCPEKYRCRGPKCAYYDCMGRFDAQTAIQHIENLIQLKSP